MLFFSSCHVDQELRNNTDIPHYLNYNNATQWRPYLLTKVPQDSARHEILMIMSEHIGEFARGLMDFSGGMTSEGYIDNYHTKVSLGENELNDFFDILKADIVHLETVSQGSEAQKEFYKYIEYITPY